MILNFTVIYSSNNTDCQAIEQAMTSANEATMLLHLKICEEVPHSIVQQGCPLTFPKPSPCFLLSLFLLYIFPCLDCNSLLLCGLCSLLFSDPEQSDAHWPQWPTFLAYMSSQVVTFPVFLVFSFTFAVTLDNHLPLKFIKDSQIVSKCCSCSNSPSLPKSPWGKSQCFALPLPV